MIRFAPTPGFRIEVLADSWAAFSATSGETLQLNAEAAAVLELLSEQPMVTQAVAHVLANDTGVAAQEIEQTLADLWPQLLTAGLIRKVG